MHRLRKIMRTISPAMICFLFLYGVAAAGVKLIKGQTIYIPSYSNIISESHRVILRGNLIIHNTDPNKSISIVKIDHYDTNGKQVAQYLSQPIELGPLAATRLTIKKLEQGDEGAGANFMVQWRAQDLVTEPIVESIMVGSLGTQGHSFSSQGRVIHEE